MTDRLEELLEALWFAAQSVDTRHGFDAIARPLLQANGLAEVAEQSIRRIVDDEFAKRGPFVHNIRFKG
jgi:hypothetical protein